MDIISFNVGGTLFETTKKTIANIPDSYLSVITRTKVGVDKDRDGNIFIDKSPDTFKFILEYHRNQDIKTIQKLIPFNLLKQLQIDCDFYMIPDLTKGLKKELTLDDISLNNVKFEYLFVYTNMNRKELHKSDVHVEFICHYLDYKFVIEYYDHIDNTKCFCTAHKYYGERCKQLKFNLENGDASYSIEHCIGPNIMAGRIKEQLYQYRNTLKFTHELVGLLFSILFTKYKGRIYDVLKLDYNRKSVSKIDYLYHKDQV
jgi:hypothetical protein